MPSQLPLSRRKVLSLALTFTIPLSDPFPAWALAPPASTTGKKYALLIGIDEYEDKDNLNRLGAAAADARKLAQTLKEVAGFGAKPGDIRLLVSDATDPQNLPSRNNIVDALDTLASLAKTGDTVFVLYSGHGIEVDGTAYLLPYDARGKSDETLADTGLSVARFRSRLEKVQAQVLFLAFDMCRTNPRKNKAAGERPALSSDTITQGKLGAKGAETSGTGIVAPSTPTRTVATLFSCDRDQSSWEWAAIGRGYFSYFLEQGLRGGAAGKDDTVRMGALLAYVASETEAAVKRDKGGALQRPYSDLHGPGDTGQLVLAVNVKPLEAGGATGGAAALMTAFVPALLEKAKDIVQFISFDPDAVVAYSEIAAGYAQVGDQEKANLYVTEAVHVAKTHMRGYNADSRSKRLPAGDVGRVWATLAQALWWTGEKTAAQQMFVQARQETLRSNSVTEKASALCTIAELQSETRDVTGMKATIAEAQKAVQSLTEHDQDDMPSRNDILGQLASVQAGIGDITEAKKTIADIKDTNLQAWSLSRLALLQVHGGNSKEAKQTLVQATQALKTDQQSYQLALAALAQTQAAMGEFSEAQKNAKLADEGVVQTLCAIVTERIRVGNLTEAKNLLGTIQNIVAAEGQTARGIPVSDLSALAAAQAQAGDYAQAEASAAQMQGKPLERIKIYCTIAITIAEHAKKEKESGK